NRSLYHGAYHRTASYFENSELAATGLPQGLELALLERYRERVPAELFEVPYAPPGTAEGRDLREALKRAAALLDEANWVVRDQRGVNAQAGEPLRLGIMLVRREDEKLALALARNCRRLGIELAVRTVDSAQYQARLASYDFDAVIYLWGESLSPGSEQEFYW